MTIRAAALRDLATIKGIWNAAIRDTAQTFNSAEKTDADLAKLLRDAPVLVAEHRGAVVGFGTYSQFRGGVGYTRTMEHTLYLDHAARGLGLGRTLLAALEEHARAAGAHVLIGGIAGENESSAQFHEAMGYTRIATLPQVGYKFGRYMDLILLQKILT